MAGARVQLTGKEKTLGELNALAARAEHPRPMWDEIGMSLVVSTQHRFEEGVSPEGSPWPPSLRAIAEGGKTLILSGRLMQSLTHNATEEGVEVGTNVIYGAVHQFGAVIKPVSKPHLAFKMLGAWVFADQVTIPARPFLGVDRDDEAEIVHIAEDYLAREMAAPDAR